MSAMGLGCVKTQVASARVEISQRNARWESSNILRARSFEPSRRIVFSTVFRCMSFHTARVNRVIFGLFAECPLYPR